jgi:biopolymer transport protein ExbB/TolQ
MDSLRHLFETGGITIYPLLLCSIIMIKAIIECSYKLYSGQRQLDDYIKGISGADDISPYGKLVKGFNKSNKSGADALKADLEAIRAFEEKKLFRGLSSLATIGVISPFIGLFGTVLGIIRTFESISKSGKMGTSVISAGVAEALIATAAGLFVAIISVVAYNWLKSVAEGISEDMEILSLHLYAQKISELNEGEKQVVN